ncbi:hypothetical protein ACTL32_09230 [Planococcus sp. FY231025]|uniref:hypothetical protein n=1 Tax=Planococcus sp. FY231025 TaxID=3455699 RepID=UPI003F8F4359
MNKMERTEKGSALHKKGGAWMMRIFFTLVSVFLFLMGAIPLALASLHWNNQPLFAFLEVNPYFPCILGALGIFCGCLGKTGDCKLYLIGMNTMNLGLYLILINLVIKTP